MSSNVNLDKLCMGCMSVLEKTGSYCPQCGFNLNNYQSGAHHLKPYTILSGKYLVGKVLGEGGFGITYLGWDLNLDIKIAIKEYYPAGLVTREITSTGTSSVTPFSGDKKEYYQNGLEKFVNEAKSLAKFYNLPGIVSVKDFFRENGTAYIVMEFIDGITLKQHLANSGGKIRPTEVFELIKPIMKSLSQIHAVGIIHRDISPDNIMLTNNGDVKLLDFGAARDFISDGNKSMSVLLKPGYAPEEQYRTKGHQGPWTDVYALCATIYKMITGITPPECLERIRKDELMPPSAMGIQLSQQIENALMKGMAIFDSNRYRNIEDLYKDIYGTTQWPSASPVHTGTPPGYEMNSVNTPVRPGQTPYVPSPANDVINHDEAQVLPMNKKNTGKKNLFITGISAVCIVLVILAVIFVPKMLSTSGNGQGIGVDNTALAGNTTGNIKNGGIAALKDGWIYYTNYSDNGYLYKIRVDGTKNTKLAAKGCNCINVVGDWVYFNNLVDKGLTSNIYKVRTDGTQMSVVISSTCPGDDITKGRILTGELYINWVYAVGDWIYYRNVGDKGYLYRIKTNGTGNIKLLDNDIDSINIEGNWIYYINKDDKDHLYKASIDGSNKVMLLSNQCSDINAAGGWIYYSNVSDKTCMCKIRTDGSDNTKLYDVKCIGINTVGDWIYYMNGDDNYALYKIKTDGTENTKLNNYQCFAISVTGDWVYYANMGGLSDHNTSFERMHTDGTGVEKIGDL